MPAEDVYRCPAGEKLKFHCANEEHGQKMRRYWTNACKTCAIKNQCTTAKERRITRWEHEHVLETVQQRLDQDPQAMRRRRETVEHPFGTAQDADGRDALPDEDAAEGRERDGAQRTRLQSAARHEYRRYEGVAGSDQGVSAETPLRVDLKPDLAQHSPR
jgi:Transposase DDE domain